jgi:hypothetical protein
MREGNTRTLREPGSTMLIKINDRYSGLRTTRLNKIILSSSNDPIYFNSIIKKN